MAAELINFMKPYPTIGGRYIYIALENCGNMLGLVVKPGITHPWLGIFTWGG